jgi:hypothetical protein
MTGRTPHASSGTIQRRSPMHTTCPSFENGTMTLTEDWYTSDMRSTRSLKATFCQLVKCPLHFNKTERSLPSFQHTVISPYPDYDQVSPPHPFILYNPFEYYPLNYDYAFKVVSFLQIFRP